MLFCKFEIIDKWIKLELCFIILVLLLQNFLNKLSLILFFKTKFILMKGFLSVRYIFFLISTILNYLWGKLRSSFLYFSSTRNIGGKFKIQQLILMTKTNTYICSSTVQRHILRILCQSISPRCLPKIPPYRRTTCGGLEKSVPQNKRSEPSKTNKKSN